MKACPRNPTDARLLFRVGQVGVRPGRFRHGQVGQFARVNPLVEVVEVKKTRVTVRWVDGGQRFELPVPEWSRVCRRMAGKSSLGAFRSTTPEPDAQIGTGDTSHLHALELGLSHEREYLSKARSSQERELRKVWIAQKEKEIASERKHLGLPVADSATDMSTDDLMDALSGFESKAETAAAVAAVRPGLRDIGTRLANAEISFRESVQERIHCTDAEAARILALYRKHKLVKYDGSRYVVKSGSLWDTDNLQEALRRSLPGGTLGAFHPMKPATVARRAAAAGADRAERHARFLNHLREANEQLKTSFKAPADGSSALTEELPDGRILSVGPSRWWTI